MVKIFLTFIFMIIFSSSVQAAEKNFEAEEVRLVCALSSLAAYGDDKGYIARQILTSRGWTLYNLTDKKNAAYVKAYLFGKKFSDDKSTKILVMTGTENIKDVEVNFRLGGVTFHKDASDGIFIHKGFRDYADFSLSGGVSEYIIDDLNANPNETLYVTGHGSGGAVATAVAARLCDMGIDKDRMKVVTFGSAAVGNKTFAKFYEDKIDLTRIEIKDDVAKKIFEPFGYVQFGKEIKYKPFKDSEPYNHKMTLYLDCAIRNYFDAGGFDFPEIVADNKIDTPIYVAPLKFLVETVSPENQKYVYALIRTGLTSRFSNVNFAEKNYFEVESVDDISSGLSSFVSDAQKLGCKYILTQLVSAERVRDATDDTRQVVLYEFFYKVDGTPIFMQTSGMTTKDVTLIEAAAFSQENLRSSLEESVNQ